MPASGSTRRRKLILISIDTLRADHLGVHGYGRNTSPNLDRLAARGVRFANAVAPSSWTLPSHATLLTGLRPSRHGAGLNARKLADLFVTLAEILRSRGYPTAALGWSATHYSITLMK